MPETYFPDSSALVKRHVQEIGSNWFSGIADTQTGNTIIISRLSISEVFSAFNRRCRELSLSQTDYQKTEWGLAWWLRRTILESSKTMTRTRVSVWP